MDTIESCGLIVFNGNSVLLIKRKDEWDLPKGKHEEGEQYRETALRETDEETGLRAQDLDISRELFPTKHFTNYDGDHHLKTTHWFLAKYKGPTDHLLIPQEDEGIQDVKWVSLGIIEQYLPEMRDYARYILNLTLDLLKVEQTQLKKKLKWGNC
jgi:8-oxo-dGTP pyrophosphatase MutT (NUDIX family)|tara:strand:+ start:2948 stop:3412 length:465 start_codon:yes stop_codon:yes gene_type:complete